VRERERLVADGGEGEGKERRRVDIVQVRIRRRMEERRKGSGNSHRDWLTADLRQGRPQLASGGALSTKQLAAPAVY
jgi:hypothetical protein